MPRERRTDDLLCNQGLLFGYLRLGRLQVRGARIKCGLTDRVRFQLRLVAAIDRLRQFGTGAQRIEPRDIVGGAQLDEHGARLDVFARLEADLVDDARQFRTQVRHLRSEERRGGEEWGSWFRSRWFPDH